MGGSNLTHANSNYLADPIPGMKPSQSVYFVTTKGSQKQFPRERAIP